LDVSRGKELIGRIRDLYWRDFARNDFPQRVAIADPAKGVSLVNATPDRERAAREAAFEIMKESPGQAARFVVNIRGINHDQLIGNIIFNIAPEQPIKAQSLLWLLRAREEKDWARLYIVKAIASGNPVTAEKMARQIQQGDVRARAFAPVAAAFMTRDVSHSRNLAREAISLTEKVPLAPGGASPIYRRLLAAVEIAPQLAKIDVSATKKLLEPITAAVSAGKEVASLRALETLRLAGAWASFDCGKAEILFERALRLDKNVCVGEHGFSLNAGFPELVAGLARQQPEHAAALL
jgi:hypothetical protein